MYITAVLIQNYNLKPVLRMRGSATSVLMATTALMGEK